MQLLEKWNVNVDNIYACDKKFSFEFSRFMENWVNDVEKMSFRMSGELRWIPSKLSSAHQMSVSYRIKTRQLFKLSQLTTFNWISPKRVKYSQLKTFCEQNADVFYGVPSHLHGTRLEKIVKKSHLINHKQITFHWCKFTTFSFSSEKQRRVRTNIRGYGVKPATFHVPQT